MHKHRPFGGAWEFRHGGSRGFGVGFIKDCGPEEWGERRGFSFEFGDDSELGGATFGVFGVRRPLRYLAHKLGLDDDQIKQLAHVLDELKTERAQAAVDSRRTHAAFADAVAGGVFDEARAAAGASLRIEGAERLRQAVLEALRRIHAMLRPEQREQLAYLIRTGRLTL